MRVVSRKPNSELRTPKGLVQTPPQPPPPRVQKNAEFAKFYEAPKAKWSHGTLPPCPLSHMAHPGPWPTSPTLPPCPLSCEDSEKAADFTEFINSVYESAVRHRDPHDPDDLFRYLHRLGAEDREAWEQALGRNKYMIALATRLQDPQAARIRDEKEGDLSNKWF